MLSITGIAHSYGGTLALDGVDLTIEHGVAGLVGVNGAGKSTLLNIAAGALKPEHGDVNVDGHNLYTASGRRRGLPRVSLMPQQFSFPSNFKVREFVEYIGYLRGLRWNEARKASLEALTRVNLQDRADSRMASLSGGMLRRVGLAQALVGDPKIILLDEPTTGLDPEQRSVVRSLIASVAVDRLVLLSSHIMEDIESLATEVMVLHSGKVHFRGSLESLKACAPAGSSGAQAAEIAFLSLITQAKVN